MIDADAVKIPDLRQDSEHLGRIYALNEIRAHSYPITSCSKQAINKPLLINNVNPTMSISLCMFSRIPKRK